MYKDLLLDNDEYEVFVGVFPKYNHMLKKDFMVMFNKAMEITSTLISDEFFTPNTESYLTAISKGSQLVTYVKNKTNMSIEAILVFSIQPVPYNLDTTPIIQCNTVYGEESKSVDICFSALGEFARLNNIPRVIFTTPRKGFLKRLSDEYSSNGALYRMLLNQSFYNTEMYNDFKQEFNLK